MTVYLITGANRGLGRSTAETYLKRPNNTVVALVRDTGHATAQSLRSVKAGAGSKLILLPFEGTNPTAAAEAISQLTSPSYGVEHLDVVLHSAGISQDATPIAVVDPTVVRRHVDTNGYSTLSVFQATHALLARSQENPRFVVIGSAIGSISGMELRAPYPMAAYGSSKAMAHYFTRRIHFEHEDITSFVLDPGFVQTDMGNTQAKAAGLEKAFTTVEEATEGLVKVIDGATRETASGKFVPAGIFAGVDGGEFPF